MIKKVNDFHAISDEGFELFSQGRDVWIYSEGDKKIWITREFAMFREGGGEYVYLSCLPNHWQSPHETTSISESKRKQIADNIQQCLVVLGARFRAA